jgi:sortase A
MKLVVERESLRRVLLWPRRLLFGSAIVLLGYCAFVLDDALLFQQRESRNLDRLLEQQPVADAATPRITPVSSSGISLVAAGGLIGRLEVARLNLSVVVIEGDNSKVLRRAVGHVPGTPLPGQFGNVAITGHRDTFFRPLRNIQQNDIITLTTLRGEYRYRVTFTRIVNPDEIGVLNPGSAEVLTLVTCYPFYFVGSAPNRFIVRAERVT